MLRSVGKHSHAHRNISSNFLFINVEKGIFSSMLIKNGFVLISIMYLIFQVNIESGSALPSKIQPVAKTYGIFFPHFPQICRKLMLLLVKFVLFFWLWKWSMEVIA